MTTALVSRGPGPIVSITTPPAGPVLSPVGTAGLIGEFQSGPVGIPLVAPSPAAARLIFGSAQSRHEAGLCLGDLYQEAGDDGAPVFVGVRVAGTGARAGALALMRRNPSRSVIFTEPAAPAEQLIIPAGNPGEWSGSDEFWFASFANAAAVAAAVSGPTLALGSLSASPCGAIHYTGFGVGGQLIIEGDPHGPYTIESSSSTQLQISGSFSDEVRLADSDITGRITILTAEGPAFAITVGQDPTRGQTFALNFERRYDVPGSFESVASLTNIQVAPSTASRRTIRSELNNSILAAYSLVDAADGLADLSANAEAWFPSNWCDLPTLAVDSTGVVTVQWYRWTESTNAGFSYVADIEPIDAARIKPSIITVTFTNATTATVKAVLSNAFEPSEGITLGTLTLDTEFDCGVPWFPKFTVSAKGTPVAADSISIYVNPLPVDLSQRNAFFYPFAVSSDGNTSLRYKIARSTYNTFTISELGTSVESATTPAEAPSVTGSANISAATWTATHTLIFTTVDGAVTFTSPGGGITGGANIVDELTSQDTDGLFVFSLSGNNLKVTLAKSKGSAATLTVGNGTGNTTFGLTNAASFTGVDGVPIRLEFRQTMRGGRDGVAPTAAQYRTYTSAERMSLVTGQNIGSVMFGTPSLVDNTYTEQLDEIVTANAWMAVEDLDSSFTESTFPTTWAPTVAQTMSAKRESNNVPRLFPSSAYFNDKTGSSLVRRSVVGAWLGLRARLAIVGVDGEKGLHLAAANNNNQGRFKTVKKVVIASLTSNLDTLLDVELLDSVGVIPILQSGPYVYAFGNRMYSINRDQAGNRVDVTDTSVTYHIARAMFFLSKAYTFKPSTMSRVSEILRDVRAAMRSFYNNGEFSDVNGPSFDQQVQIAAPKNLNTPFTLAVDKTATITVSFIPRGSLRAVRIFVSPSSVNIE